MVALLLGTATAETVTVSQTLPLFHSSIAVAPMLEAALLRAEAAADSAAPAEVATPSMEELREEQALLDIIFCRVFRLLSIDFGSFPAHSLS